ncbi:MAG: metallophosphoesterase [Elusimicrobiota bacterium]
MNGPMAMALFLATVISIYLGMQYYVAFWVIRYFPGFPVHPAIIRCAVLLIALSSPFSLFWLRRHGGPAAEAFAFAACVWLGVSFVWLVWGLLGDLVWVIARIAGTSTSVKRIIGQTVLAVVAALCLYAFWSASRPPELKRIELAVPGLPAALDGFSIVQISDLHLDTTIPLKRLEQAAAMIAAIGPDLIAFTGDIVEPGFRKKARLKELGSRMRAKYGAVAVLGNHEFYLGTKTAIECHESLGARLLRDEVIELPAGIQVAGVDDIRTSRMTREEVRQVLRKLDPDKPSVFLSHQPMMFDLAAEHGVDLMLSGHTHRGQIFPFHAFVKMSHPYFHGLYHIGDSRLYVTSGAGHWGPPMRLFAPSEVVHITLRSKSSRP